MTLRTTTVASTCAALALAWVAGAQPALARWTFHDDTVGEKVTAPPGGTRAQTCAARLRAVSGYAHNIDVTGGEDPSAFQIPPQARTAVTYEVWKAPAGFHSFDGASRDAQGVFFEDPDGTRHSATLVAHVTTPPRRPLPTPEPSGGNRHVSGEFVFTTAPISAPLHGVAPGDALGLNPAQHDSWVNVTAMSCRLPVVASRVDVIPGSQPNVVHPENATELVPVRVFGSRRLHVGRIIAVHLGEAAPTTPPPAQQPSLRPHDVNGDGRADRLYYFRQGDTDIMCVDTHVTVTGQTNDHKRFQGGNDITTAGCAG
jgi:hypothetical protein